MTHKPVAHIPGENIHKRSVVFSSHWLHCSTQAHFQIQTRTKLIINVGTGPWLSQSGTNGAAFSTFFHKENGIIKKAKIFNLPKFSRFKFSSRRVREAVLQVQTSLFSF
jgi:hypothetical protein